LSALCLFFSAVALSEDHAWKEYVYAADGFAISSPVAPVLQKRAMKPAAGEIEAHFYFIPLESCSLVVMYAPLHPNDQRTPEQALQDSKKGVLLGGGKLISEKPISVGNYPGMEYETDDGQHHQRGRFYAIDRKMYTLAADVPSGKEFPAEVERWYKSFRIISASN
jgi:hypothetical protein